MWLVSSFENKNFRKKTPANHFTICINYVCYIPFYVHMIILLKKGDSKGLV